MAHDPVLVADTREWLRRADDDLRAAEADLATAPPLVRDALFHSQQAVEKSFKTFLTFHDQAFRRTHNLEEIGEACLLVDTSLRLVVDEVVPLSEYAWAYRYPGPSATPDATEAETALAIARRAYQAILNRLPQEVHG